MNKALYTIIDETGDLQTKVDWLGKTLNSTGVSAYKVMFAKDKQTMVDYVSTVEEK